MIFDEVEKYRAMKEELCRKDAPTAGSVTDEAIKNEPIKWGHNEARASFIKNLPHLNLLLPQVHLLVSNSQQDRSIILSHLTYCTLVLLGITHFWADKKV